MSCIASLPTSNGTRLEFLQTDCIAVCGDRTAYVVTHEGGGQSNCLAAIAVPDEADTYGLWLAPGSQVQDVIVVYSVVDANVCRVMMKVVKQTVNVSLDDNIDGFVVALSILYQTILAVRTTKSFFFYCLDRSAISDSAETVELRRMGCCPLTSVPGSSDCAVLLSTPPMHSGADDKQIVVAEFNNMLGRLHLQVLSVASAVSARVQCSTSSDGLALPPMFQAGEVTLAEWTINWTQQEIVLLLRDVPSRSVACCSLSLRPTTGTVLSTWVRHSPLLTAATRPTLERAAQLLCTRSGSFWSLDTKAGSSVLLKNLSSSALEEVALPGSNTAEPVAAVVGWQSLYVVAGKRVYRLTDSDSTGGRGVRCDTLSQWLQQQQRSCASASTEQQDKVQSLAHCLLANEALPSGIVRDSLFVSKVKCCASSGGYCYRHDLLWVLLEQAQRPDGVYPRALLQYIALVQSVHPFSVLMALRPVLSQDMADGAAAEGFTLAVAVVLAQKPAFQDGGLQRMPELPAAAASFFSCEERPLFSSEIEKKRYLANLCGAAVSGLAAGALGAVRVLLTVADASVEVLYGRLQSVRVQEETTLESMQVEEIILESLHVLSSYSEWALSAAAMLGIMTAYVGSPSTTRKEATLRDGVSHPISTSRNIEIERLRISRQPQV